MLVRVGSIALLRDASNVCFKFFILHGLICNGASPGFTLIQLNVTERESATHLVSPATFRALVRRCSTTLAAMAQEVQVCLVYISYHCAFRTPEWGFMPSDSTTQYVNSTSRSRLRAVHGVWELPGRLLLFRRLLRRNFQRRLFVPGVSHNLPRSSILEPE